MHHKVKAEKQPTVDLGNSKIYYKLIIILLKNYIIN